MSRSGGDKILLAHGSGGKAMHELINSLFLPVFKNPYLEPLGDSALFEIDGSTVAFTTDSYVVDPLFFPGGDIGKLAVCGTINDLAVTGAKPIALSCALVIEEGLSRDDLERIIKSMQAASEEAGVQIVTGDTKVLPRGKGDKIFINTAGIGLVPDDRKPVPGKAEVGDVVLINGPIAEHGAAVMAEREGFRLSEEITSDVAPLYNLIDELLTVVPEVHCLKDPTRGGIASALNEIATSSKVSIILDESSIPVRKPVLSLCELLGLDPIYFANEGKVLVIVPQEKSNLTLKTMRSNTLGRESVVIGEVRPFNRVPLSARTAIGSHRVIGMLTGDQLPRIC